MSRCDKNNFWNILRDLAQQAVQEEAGREMQGGEEECKRNAEEKECDRVVTEGGGSVLCVCVCVCPQAQAHISCIKWRDRSLPITTTGGPGRGWILSSYQMSVKGKKKILNSLTI